jgi:hypothetical protein
VEEVQVSKTMPLVISLSGTTNKNQTLDFHRRNCGSVRKEHNKECIPLVLPLLLLKAAAASLQTPDKHEEPMLHCSYRSQYPLHHYQPPITANIAFFTSVSFTKIYNKKYLIAPKKG